MKTTSPWSTACRQSAMYPSRKSTNNIGYILMKNKLSWYLLQKIQTAVIPCDWNNTDEISERKIVLLLHMEKKHKYSLK